MRDLNRWHKSGQKGNRGEELASKHLAEQEYETSEPNYRTRHGEIVLIVRGERALVFDFYEGITLKEIGTALELFEGV